ncbi:DedA family protein [Halarcobacter bivalviorum]|uniref:DedA family membrane protein, type I (SNARE domain) n=1 Tax=Halarcobacter bivalviorum TaxID=663364 RepID=A0AAX2AC50_9BACT|nr:DedA family protein [Halarcobacter bivalviorum]AXH12767.1 DedA family membrane protein, type I (SNARE domain) [Halarcobacter bivalviorum]RXK08197.1 DedA family protein [Halarcobacter bivalviorum]RXK10316.1 DedA family protein [Halarcobacter bivalviorum]
MKVVLKNNSGKILFVVVALFVIFLGYSLYQAPVEGIENRFIYLLKTYGYIILFAWSILEGEAGLVMAGLLSHTGDMNMYMAIFIAGLGGFAGDQIYFYTGRFNKSYVHKKFKGQRRKFALAHILLQKYGWPIIFVQRYMYGMRTIIPISIGLTRYSAKTFAFINLISAWCWAAITIVPVWYFGEEILIVLKWLKEHWYYALPFALLIGGSIVYYFHIMTKKKEK